MTWHFYVLKNDSKEVQRERYLMLRIKYPIYALSSFEIFEGMTWHFYVLKNDSKEVQSTIFNAKN
jgi:hypothetical protein